MAFINKYDLKIYDDNDPSINNNSDIWLKCKDDHLAPIILEFIKKGYDITTVEAGPYYLLTGDLESFDYITEESFKKIINELYNDYDTNFYKTMLNVCMHSVEEVVMDDNKTKLYKCKYSNFNAPIFIIIEFKENYFSNNPKFDSLFTFISTKKKNAFAFVPSYTVGDDNYMLLNNEILNFMTKLNKFVLDLPINIKETS